MAKAKLDKGPIVPVGPSGYPTMHELLVPKAMFFTNGVGVHKDRLSSFELSLRDAGIEKANLVTVSSIFVTRLIGIGEANGAGGAPRLLATIRGKSDPGYGETAKKAGDYAEDLAATMLATTLGIEFDSEKAWSERDQAFKMEKRILKTRNVVQSAEGNAKGQWSTVVALGVFIF